MTDLKEKAIYGMIWSAVERFGYMLIMFLSNLFLARLLSPDDFGLIGMILIFITIANIIVDGGFASALIQKKTINDRDYSTAFYVNIIIALFLYLLLYYSAPCISNFYKEPLLTFLLRVIGIVLLTNSLSVVQIAKIKRELNFKYLGIVSIVSSFLGCCLGVACAFCSLGVWSLVIQMLTISLIRSIMLFVTSSWKPSCYFSIGVLKQQFSFGSMILLSNLIDTIYSNTLPLIIGRSFSSKTLGLYTQARTLESVPNQTLTTIVGQVTFHIFSKLQYETRKLLNGLRKTTRCLVYINFPLMILLIIIADPLFRILYTEKWVEAVPFFQIACLGGMLSSSIQLNNSILLAQGFSKLFFFSRLVKQLLGFFLILMIAFIGNLWWLMIVGTVLIPLLFLFVSIFYTRRVMPCYGFKEQILNIGDILLISLLCGCISYVLCDYVFLECIFIELCMKVVVYCLLYMLISRYFLVEEFQIFYNEIKQLFVKLKSTKMHL